MTQEMGNQKWTNMLMNYSNRKWNKWTKNILMKMTDLKGLWNRLKRRIKVRKKIWMHKGSSRTWWRLHDWCPGMRLSSIGRKNNKTRWIVVLKRLKEDSRRTISILSAKKLKNDCNEFYYIILISFVNDITITLRIVSQSKALLN